MRPVIMKKDDHEKRPVPFSGLAFYFGSGGRTRTCDKAINSRLLYQLSYAGSGVPCARRLDGGADRNRTGVHGFAGRCVATPPPRHPAQCKPWLLLVCKGSRGAPLPSSVKAAGT